MPLFRSLGFAVALIALLAAPAAAQSFTLNPTVTSSLETDGLHLTIGLENTGFGFVRWDRAPAGVDLYRRPLGIQCGDAVRLTDTPIAWNWNDLARFPEFALQIRYVDATTVEGVGYRYELRAVDADRNPVAGDPDAVVGFATHGEALLGHGYLWSGGDCGLSYTQEVQTCVDECFPGVLASTASELSPYFNTGQTLLLYGRITGVMRLFCNGSIAQAFFTRGVPSRCVVGVEAMTWTAAKRLYR